MSGKKYCKTILKGNEMGENIEAKCTVQRPYTYSITIAYLQRGNIRLRYTTVYYCTLKAHMTYSSIRYIVFV